MNACRNFHAIMEWQVDRMHESIDEMKWYASERCGHDVGNAVAEDEFLKQHMKECGKKWRKEYCSNHCHLFHECELGQSFVNS